MENLHGTQADALDTIEDPIAPPSHAHFTNLGDVPLSPHNTTIVEPPVHAHYIDYEEAIAAEGAQIVPPPHAHLPDHHDALESHQREILYPPPIPHEAHFVGRQ